jgi:very-short-patch-repair endonuclease
MNDRFRASPELRERAKAMRREPTSSEALLWNHLRNRRHEGFRWRPQYAVGGYVLDFYWPAAKLVIELDGSQHDVPDAVEYDRLRTEYLAVRGLTVIRFRNGEVMNDTASVLDRIESELRKLAPSPNPLSRGRGLNTWTGLSIVFPEWTSVGLALVIQFCRTTIPPTHKALFLGRERALWVRVRGYVSVNRVSN